MSFIYSTISRRRRQTKASDSLNFVTQSLCVCEISKLDSAYFNISGKQKAKDTNLISLRSSSLPLGMCGEAQIILPSLAKVFSAKPILSRFTSLQFFASQPIAKENDR